VLLWLTGIVWFARTQRSGRLVGRGAAIIAIGATAAALGACGGAPNRHAESIAMVPVCVRCPSHSAP